MAGFGSTSSVKTGTEKTGRALWEEKSKFTCTEYVCTTDESLQISQNTIFAKCASSCTGNFCCSAEHGVALSVFAVF